MSTDNDHVQVGSTVWLEDGVARSVRDGRLVLAGIDLRYLLTALLIEAGSTRTVEWLAAVALADGFALRGRPSKVVSDALRWEVARGRVVRIARGRYAPGSMPRQTKSRIRRRVALLRRSASQPGAAGRYDDHLRHAPAT